VQAGHRAAGWRLLDPSSRLAHEDDDPDAALRPPRWSAGHDWINSRLGGNRDIAGAQIPSERVAPLHPMPPDVCAALGRTILFGWLPVASGEAVDDDTPAGALPEPDDIDRQRLQEHLAHYLKAGDVKPLPKPGEAVSEAWIDLDDPDHAPLEPFVTLLLQLRNEFDAFGDSGASRALAAELQLLRVLTVSAAAKDAVGADRVAELVRRCVARGAALAAPAEFDTATRIELARVVNEDFPWGAMEAIERFLTGLTVHSAGPFLRDAADALTGTRDVAVTLPDYWLPVSADQSWRIAQACLASAVARHDRLFVAGRAYSEPGERYAARCFIRVRRADGCPPDLVWSGYTDEFTVAPWWESAGVRPRVIPMPDPFDRGLLRQLRPDVAFAMPASLADLMSRANLKKIDDRDRPSRQPGLDWICGFNIPLITLCAMIVLHVFLLVLNIVFGWLPFIKICIPVPRKK
jgi:hypothetical protein